MTTSKEYPCKNIKTSHMPSWQDACWQEAPQRFLADTVTGETPFLNTELRLFRDDGQEALFVRFVGEDDEVISTFRLHDECLYKQDVFELFIAEDSLEKYLELEVSPYDLHFVGDICNDQEGIRIDMGREMPGFQTKTWLLRKKLKTVSVWCIPYSAFAKKPGEGEQYRFNAFRIDHSVRGRSLQALNPTAEANFHVPSAFVPLVFVS